MKLRYPDPRSIPVKERLRVCLEMVFAQKLKDKVLVDVGCSYGWLPTLLSDKHLKKIVGVDPSVEAIKAAKKSAPKAQFLEAPAERLPVKDNFADYVTMFDVLEHVPVGFDPVALDEAYRVLKRGGTMLFSTPNWNVFTNLFDPAWYLGHRHYKVDRLKKMLTTAGFTNISIEVRGGLWFSFYLLWLYIGKRITSKTFPINGFLLEKSDQEFSKKGTHTIFVVAKKK